jgi:1,4-alpha-glucan branching enzyme
VYHAWNPTRVVAFHRWLPDSGRDVIVVGSFNELTHGGYELGFPSGGRWLEVFNSDFYDGLPNPSTVGNGGAVVADGPPRHGFSYSASIVIPANGLLVFTRAV